jgi:cytochrome c oxidase subunit 2
MTGPTFKGLWGKKETVVTGGQKREVEVNEEYLRRSISEPNADVVEGFQPGLMPPQSLKDVQIKSLILYLQSLK